MRKHKTAQPDRKLLLSTAKAIVAQAKLAIAGQRAQLRKPTQASVTNTDGWSVTLGGLGRGQPRLELWLDRFAGHKTRKFYIGFVSGNRKQIAHIKKSVSDQRVPVRQVQQKDITKEKVWRLTVPLKPGEFNGPVYENYEKGKTYFGLFDTTRLSTQRVNPYFCERAVSFIEDVLAALPATDLEDRNRQVYPRIENRKRVATHLRRERSGLLATECKIRDKYRCQICGFAFGDMYGAIGKDFAEAHHLVPLGELNGKVVTNLKDLVTVCANCHRMLHRMSGKRGDVPKLKGLVRQVSKLKGQQSRLPDRPAAGVAGKRNLKGPVTWQSPSH
jgi:5-methylcytosine-specific restriction endonuclease McrA